MTVSSTVSRATYVGDGVSTVFAVPFRFLDATHLRVVKRSTAGVETAQVLSTDYSVSGVDADSGGSISMNVAPATGETLAISRRVPADQALDYVENDPFPAASHERGLDKLTMIAQQLVEDVKRSLLVPETDAQIGNMLLPDADARANQYLVFDAEGNPVVSFGTGADAGLRSDLASSVSGKGTALIGGLISQTTNFYIPGDFADLYAFKAYIDTVTVVRGARVNVYVANGDYFMPQTFNWNHPQSRQFSFRGNPTNRSLCRLYGSALSLEMIRVDAQSTLDIDGFTLEHTNAANKLYSSGLIVEECAWLIAGGAMHIKGFHWSVHNRRGGTTRLLQTGSTRGLSELSGDCGLLVLGGFVWANGWDFNTSSAQPSDPDPTLGSGVVNEGGFVFLANVTGSGSLRAGLHHINGYTRVNNGCNFSGNINNNIRVDQPFVDISSSVTAGGSVSGYGLGGDGLAGMIGYGNVTDGGSPNSLGLFRDFLRPIHTAGQVGFQVVSPNNASRRYDSTGNHYFNTLGGYQFGIINVANPVSRFVVSGAPTGVDLDLAVSSNDVNCGGWIKPKGVGGSGLKDGNNVVRVHANNTGVGFNGTAPIAKPTITGSRGGNAALAALLTQLASYGLITDGSTA